MRQTSSNAPAGQDGFVSDPAKALRTAGKPGEEFDGTFAAEMTEIRKIK